MKNLERKEMLLVELEELLATQEQTREISVKSPGIWLQGTNMKRAT